MVRVQALGGLLRMMLLGIIDAYEGLTVEHLEDTRCAGLVADVSVGFLGF